VSCVFCDIVAGLREADVVYEDEGSIAFLDIRPVFPGHVLVVPRRHHETIEDLPGTELGPYFGSVQWVATAVRTATGAQGTFVAQNNVVSQSVPHLHVHVVPRTKGDGLRGFFWPRTGYDDDAHRSRVAAAIRAAAGA
jgi:histidine triad (HIT) family protein